MSPAATSTLHQVLAGCVVLVTADRRSQELASALERRGASVRHAPALSIVAHADDELLAQATRAVVADPPDIVVVTTGIGFRGWVEAADAHGLADELLAVLRRARIIARGPKARGAVIQAGLDVDWVAESETAAEVLQHLLREPLTGQRLVVQHHGAGADGLDRDLAAAGALVTDVVVYRWGPPPDPATVRASVLAAADGEVDAVVFTSAPGAHAWLAAADDAGALERIVSRAGQGSLVAAAVGPVTAIPLQQRGIEPLVPDRSRLGALVRALVAHYENVPFTVVDTPVGELVVRQGVAQLDGRLLALSPGGLAVLSLLAARAGDVVSRGAILDVLPGESTDPHAAEVAVARVRDVIARAFAATHEARGEVREVRGGTGEGSADQGMAGRDVIATVVKRGYRLVVRTS